MKIFLFLINFIFGNRETKEYINKLANIFNNNAQCVNSTIDSNIIDCENIGKRYTPIDGSCNNCVDNRLGKAFIPLKVNTFFLYFYVLITFINDQNNDSHLNLTILF